MFVTNWEQVELTEINDQNYKMYRDLYKSKKNIEVEYTGQEADKLAFDYLKSEQFAGKILDTNKEIVCDMLGDLTAIKKIKIPVY